MSGCFTLFFGCVCLLWSLWLCFVGVGLVWGRVFWVAGYGVVWGMGFWGLGRVAFIRVGVLSCREGVDFD